MFSGRFKYSSVVSLHIRAGRTFFVSRSVVINEKNKKIVVVAAVVAIVCPTINNPLSLASLNHEQLMSHLPLPSSIIPANNDCASLPKLPNREIITS
jgi:hypothetical protein